MAPATLPQNNISWPELMIAAESNNEVFEDVRIVTAKSQYFEDVYELAIMKLVNQSKNIDFDINAINQTAKEIIHEYAPYISEYAEITPEGSTVCINVEQITDDNVWDAFGLLYKAIENGGKWESDETIRFPWVDLTID